MRTSATGAEKVQNVQNAPYMSELESAAGTILLADDDDDLRSAIVDILQDAGYSVVPFASSALALAYLSEVAGGLRKCPALVIADFCMPGLSGIGVIRLLRGLQPKPSAILLSGFPDPSLARLARAAGAVSFLKKPFLREDLESAVRSALAGAAPGLARAPARS